MAEKEQQHRHEMEHLDRENWKWNCEKIRRERQRGQWLGFVLGTLAVFCGTTVALFSSPSAGALIACSGAVGIVSAFIAGRLIKAESDQTR